MTDEVFEVGETCFFSLEYTPYCYLIGKVKLVHRNDDGAVSRIAVDAAGCLYSVLPGHLYHINPSLKATSEES